MYNTLEEAKEKHPDCSAFTWKSDNSGVWYWYPKEKYSMTGVEFGKDTYTGTPSPIDGHVFTGKKDWLNHMKKHNVVCKE